MGFKAQYTEETKQQADGDGTRITSMAHERLEDRGCYRQGCDSEIGGLGERRQWHYDSGTTALDRL